MITTESLKGSQLKLPSTSRAVRYTPLFFGASMIVAMGYATWITSGGHDQGTAQQAPPKTDTPQTQAKPPVKTPPPVAMAEAVPGITFADKSGITYVVARTLAQRLGLEIELDPAEKVMTIGSQTFEGFRRLYAGDILIPIRDISKFEGTVEAKPDDSGMIVRSNGIQFEVIVGKKHIEVDKAAQVLTAYQGDLVVIKTNVSTGRPGHNTPNGDFTTGPKERMHYSHKYNDAEMPYAVQVNGDVFFHGFGSVPHYPASHGCIRVPLGRKNPAKYLFSWVNRGVDVKVFGTYVWETHHTRRRHRKAKH